MRVWQAIWCPRNNETSGYFSIWGETLTHAAASGEASILRRHPRALTSDHILNDLHSLDCEAGQTSSLELFLPSEVTPLPSARLVSPSDETVDYSLLPWHTPAVKLERLDAIALFSSLPYELPSGLVLDDSFRFWVESVKFLLDLLSRGRFIPTFERELSTAHARWRMLLSDSNDRKRMETFVRCLPAAGLMSVDLPKLSGIARASFLEQFFQECGDVLIRSFIAPRSFELASDARQSAPSRRVSERWFASLAEANSAVKSPAFELLDLEQRLKRWARKLLPTSGDVHVRTSFVLNPPGEISDVMPNIADQDWRLELFIQAMDDESKMLHAEKLWRGELGFLEESDQIIEGLETALLQDLGRASALFPPLARALENTFPTSVALSVAEAYRFLAHASQQLLERGYGVILPSWWRNKKNTAGLHLDVQSKKKVGTPESRTELGLRELLDFSWKVSLGDRQLSVEAFRELVEKNTPLIQIGGDWVEIDPERAQATLDFLRKQESAGPVSALSALRLGLGVDALESIFPVVGLSTSGWLEQLLSPGKALIPVSAQPEGFHGELRPYQQEGLSWLNFLAQAGVGGCLADDMGLGKTIQFLALLLLERELATLTDGGRERLGPTLLIVPMSILDNWQREADRFAPTLRVLLHHGPTRLGLKLFQEAAAQADLVVTTYSLAYRDQGLFESVQWQRIALDEAQSIKNVATKQTQAIRKITQTQLRENSHILQRIALTGTPLENHLEELWSIFDFLNPGFLGTIGEFRRRFVVPIDRYRDEQASDTLSKMIRPFVLRRMKRDPKVIQELPEKIEMEELITLTEEQAVLYQQVVETMLPHVDNAMGIHRKGMVLATITKLKQICDHPALFLREDRVVANRSGKLIHLEEFLDVVLAENDKVLIFTQYAQLGHLLKPYLEDRFRQEVPFLYGGVSQSGRMKLVDQFQRDAKTQIFLLSLKAGGLGLNLTAANQVVHFDQWWNPAVEEQATDRAYRIGQLRNVQVRKFVCKGTLEERIAAMLQRKRALAEEIVGSTKNLITEMSSDELRRLLELSSSSTLEEADVVE